MAAAWDNEEATTSESSSSDSKKEQVSLALMVGLDEVHFDPSFNSCTDSGSESEDLEEVFNELYEKYIVH
ncbi:hypothetical protein Taro_045296 [Colocasia esculenta]|uniref:Uncharacterized protein n=1 Tax=Colocasia esculenta TaxID=4460 RepID=A0A843WQW3_COLES|nr:hypothetical protein [Colocasia esculenta]